MTDQNEGEVKVPDPVQMSRNMADIAERSSKIVNDFLQRQAQQAPNTQVDPFNIGQAFFDMTSRMMSNPAKIAEAQMELWQQYLQLWQSTAQRMMGDESDPVVTPERGDRRFKDPSWEENQLFDFIKQSYLLTARWIQEQVHEVEGMDDKTAQKVDFYTRQFVDALAPSNFVMTNPEVLRTTLESGGENLVNGLQNLLDDLERGKGQLAISMTDREAFEVGGNIAITPGKVIYQNELMQLIQYEPATENVHKAPLLIIPPWINKYYILDLREKNSFVKWAVEQGLTVFVISWVNPDEKLAAKTFEDYMTQGFFEAFDAMTEATGEKEANVIGYCLGGTLLAASMAYLHAKKPEDPGPDPEQIKSTTFFTAMTDFSEAGELGVFIDEAQLNALEEKMQEKGYLEGSAMANTFNMLRANDLIWSFVINNYLLGKDPFPFDLLYWNSDSTRMPATMHSFYLRRMYQENKLIEPGGITLKGVPIDLSAIKTPSFMLSAREDHIAPWKGTYALTQFAKGPVKFILAASGHIAGVINPPASGKYCYWTNSRNPKNPETWLKNAEEHPGSWWPEWYRWIARKSGPKKTPARTPGGGKLKPIEEAPGSYVRVKAE
ncbi:PHA/PHB synthase family protein [Fodinicurvata halophila]|uniref:PHA/PHB synthase family protein n=1 Tax=Fodinicurvata halophila TaxID=1419723 RepID=A0ABV8UJS3_9PROT